MKLGNKLKLPNGGGADDTVISRNLREGGLMDFLFDISPVRLALMTGIGIGMFLGIIMGLIVASLCVAAKRGDELEEITEYDILERF